MSAVGAAGGAPSKRAGAPYSFELVFFLGLAAVVLARAVSRLRLRRALSFRWLVRRRIFIERRLSRLPMRSQLLVCGAHVKVTKIGTLTGSRSPRDELGPAKLAL